jgi:L-serine kinase (ATP) / ParB family transcriptional regulator, heme-responsive regulator
MDILSSLRLVNIGQLELHEDHEPSRLTATCAAIQDEGVLRHPLLAVQSSSGSYLVLDGVHRTKTLEALGCKRAPVQVVSPEEVILQSWVHQVSKGFWMSEVFEDPYLHITPLKKKETALLAEVEEADGNRLYIYPATGAGEKERMEAWRRLVKAYSSRHAVTRIPPDEAEPPAKGRVLVRHAPASLAMVKETVRRGEVMPAGVTRFIVPNRLLNVRVPLDFLTREKPNLDQWQQFCSQLEGNLRHYTESVYLCEV